MARRVFPEFRAQFESTLYPFMDTATMVVSGTNRQLDRDVFLDASLYPIGAAGAIYLSHLSVRPGEIRLAIADRTRTERAATTFDPAAAPEVLQLRDAWGRPAGILLSSPDRLARFSTWPVGDYQFQQAATPFVPGCVIPTPEQGVRGILTPAGELLTGNILLVGGEGVVIRQDGPETIRVDIVGDPLFRRRLCTPVDLFQAPNFIRTINGCPPDPQGNYNLTVGGHLNDATVVRVSANRDGLVIGAVGTTQSVR